ncbi:MAG: septum site-determining protein MinC, partial [Prochlorococcaceae cyanobacterium]
RLCCGSWALRLPQLRSIATLVESRGLCLREVDGDDPETLVAAAALGLVSSPPLPAASHGPAEATAADGLTILRRTLRSGDQVDSKGSLLVLGDVNPGAQVSAVGHVLVWGRLRGVAHAGCDGDAGARIVALQLRPVQLRIAGAVARGPEGVPPAGLAEQALLVDGEIRIEAADPLWPLDN